MASQDFFVNLKFKLEDLSKDITKGTASNFLNEVRKISQELKKLDIQNIPEFKDIFQMGGKIRIDLDFNGNEFKKINLHLEEIKSVLKELTSGQVLSKELLNLFKTIENFAKTLNTISVNKNIDLSFIKKVITDYKEAIEALPQKPLNENTIIKFLENIYIFLNLIQKIGAEISFLQNYKFPSKRAIKNFFENFNDIFVYIQEFNKTLRADFIQLTQIENFQNLIGKEKEIREFVISRLELFIETFARITNIVSNTFPHLLRTFTTYKDDINNYIEIIVNFIKQFNVSNLTVISESELENIKKIFRMLSEILQELSKVNETIYTPGKYINTDNLLRDLRNLTGIVKEIELVIKDLQNISKVNQIKINKLDITHLFTIINEITKEVEIFLKNNNFNSVISGDILKKWEGIDTFLANLTSILRNLSNFKTIKINNQQAINLSEGLKFFLKISQELSSLKTTIQSNLNTDELFFIREDIENLGRIGVILRDLSFFIQNLFDIISNTSIQNFDDIVPKIEKYFNIIRVVLQRIADIIPYINTIYQNLNTGVKLSNFTDFNTFLNSFIYNIDTSNEQLKEIINRNTNFNNTLRMVSTTSERTIQELRNWKELLKGRVINEFQEIFLGSYDLNKILSEYLGRFSSINRLDFSKFNLDTLTKLKEILVGADINNPQLVRAIFNNLKNTLRKVGIYLKNTSNINEMKQILSEWEQAIRGLFVSGFSQVNLKLISEHRKTLDYYLNQLDKSLDKTLPYVLDKIKNILSKYYKTLGYKSKYEVFNIFKTGIGVEEIINLGLSRITNKIDKQELEKLNKRLQSIIENANKAGSRIENVLKQVKVQKGLSFSDEDLQQLDRVLQHLTWKTFQVSWGFIYINMALDKTITKIKDFLRDVIQTSRELQLIQIRLRGLSEQTSKFASYSQQEFKELMEISAKTPYTIRDISEAWTQFKALGIDNMKVFKDTIDTAITFGIEVSRIADDIARAIQGDATAFKNLRHSIGLTNVVIKQFGGSVDDSGRLSNKTFKDIKNNAEALMRYLQKYTGASEKTISSLSQAISNLQDIVNIFYAKTAENLAGLGDFLGQISLSILNVYRTQEGLINELSKTFGTFLLIIAGSIPAVEGLSKAFIIFNDIVFMFMTGISSFGMSLTVLPKFLNNTQRAIKELSLAMGISVKRAESLVNMYRNLHKVVASSSFEIFEIFMNKTISFALNLINFAISFVKTHFFGLLISTLMTVWGIYTKNTVLEIERRREELNKVKKLLSEDLGATILPEITEETFDFYEILKKITDISDKLVQNFGLTEEKAFKMSKNILLQQSSIEDIYKYMLQLSYLKPFRFTINIQEYIDKLEDYKQAIETLNQTPIFGIQQNLVRTALASIIYYIKIESILRDFIKRITTRKPVEKLPIDFYQQIFAPKYYQDLTKILEIEDKVFTSAKLETRLLIEQTKDFFNLFKEELQKKLEKYISNLEQQILEIIKKISPETKINDIENLSKEILDKLNKNKDFQRLYKDYNLSLFILRNLKVIDDYNLLSKKYLQILSKEDTQEINIPEMFRKAQLFKKNISYLNYNLREFFRNFTTSTELISGINKFIEDISRLSKEDTPKRKVSINNLIRDFPKTTKDLGNISQINKENIISEFIKGYSVITNLTTSSYEDFTDDLIDYFKYKYKLLKGTDVNIRESISSKLEGKIEKYITKNEYINSIIESIQDEILEAFKTNTREAILNYPKVLNEILDKIVQNLINLKIIEETHRKEVERIIRVALFGNAISNIIFILRKGIVNLSDEVKQVLLQALNKIEMSDEIRNEIKQSIESGIIILTRENKKIFKNIIKNIKNINKYYQELSKLQFPDDLDDLNDILGFNKIKVFFENLNKKFRVLVDRIIGGFEDIIQSSFKYGFNLFTRNLKILGQNFISNTKLFLNFISIPFAFIGRIFTKTIDIISPKVKEFFEKSINNLLNKFKKPETPPGVPKNIDKLTTEFSKNIRGVSSNLKTLAEIIEKVGKKFQDIRDYKVLQDVKNKILKLKSPFQSLYLIPETLEKQVQRVSSIEKALLRLGITRFLRGEYKLGPTLLKIVEAWDNTIEKGLTTYEKMVLEGIKRSGFLKNILTFVGKTLRFIADSFLKIGAIIFNIFVDIIDSFIGAFYISRKTGETWIKAFSERFKDTLTGMFLSFISNLFKGSFWKNLINNIFNTFLNILSKIADFLWGGTIQKIIEQQGKKKLQDKVKNILISKGLNTDDLNKATDKINNFIEDTINELQTALNKFNQNLQNINIEEFGYAIQEYLRNIFDILVNSKVNFAGKEITLSDLLKEDNLLKYQIEDITQIKILWKSILESIKAYNDAIDKAIDLIKKLYDNTFSYEEMRKKYYDELIQNLKEDEKGVSELLDEDLKKLEDVYNRIENKKKELIQKLEKFKIKINFDTDKIDFKDIVNKLKEKLSIKFEVELKEDMKEEERIKKITNFINILRNTVDLTDKEVDRLNKILGDYATSKNKTQKQEIEKYFKGEEIIQPQYITKEDLVLREKINKYQKEGINLQEEINRLEEEYNNLLNNTQFNIGKIVQKLKELRDISQEIKEKTKGFDIDFLKNLIDNTKLQLREVKKTQLDLIAYYGDEIKRLDDKIEEDKKELEKAKKNNHKEDIEFYEKEIQKNKMLKQIAEDILKQIQNKRTTLEKNLALYEQESKKLKDNYAISQFLNKNLGQNLSQIINFNRNLRSQRGFFENKDIPLFYKVNNILKSMGLNLKDINTLMSKFFDKSGKITEEGILFVRKIFNEYYKDEKEYYDLQKEYIDRNLIGLQKISSITQLINEIEYNTNLTLEERQDLINELLDLQLEEIKNLTDIYTGWSKLKEIIRYIGSSFTLTDKQKLDLTDKLTQQAEEYLDLTKNIYEYESSIDEILKQQLVKGIKAVKLNKEKYEKMLDIIKDYKEDKKLEGYIYVLNKVISDNLLPPEVINELKERIYDDLFNTETFKTHFEKIKEEFIDTFKDTKLFDIYRVLNPKRIGDFIQNYFKNNKIKINLDFNSEAFKKLVKELGNTIIEVFKQKIEELKGVISELREKYGLPKEEDDKKKLEELYQQGLITFGEYASGKMAMQKIEEIQKQQEEGIYVPFAKQTEEFNRGIVDSILNKAEERLKVKEQELKAEEAKKQADFNASVNNFATAVKNFENAVSALGGLIASLGKGGGAVGGTTQNNQNQQTNQTNINQTNVNNNVNIINNLPSGSVYFPFLGPTE